MEIFVVFCIQSKRGIISGCCGSVGDTLAIESTEWSTGGVAEMRGLKGNLKLLNDLIELVGDDFNEAVAEGFLLDDSKVRVTVFCSGPTKHLASNCS
jgi:hypothetical protein